MNFTYDIAKITELLKFRLPSSDGDVRVNWTTVTKSNTTLKTGDVISVSGKGRLKVSHLFSDLLNAILLLGDQPRHCFFEILG